MELDEFIENEFLTRDYTPSINTIAGSNLTLTTTKTLRFDVIVKFFNKVAEVRGREKSKFIKAFIAHLFKTNRKTEYVYSILRLILPAEDRERGNYGVKEKSLAIIIRDSLGLPKKDYQRLKHFKNPSYHEGGQGMGDFPSIASGICSQFCNKTSSITIDQVNKILDDLVQKVDSKEQVLIFTNILKQCTAQEILWIIRIILKDTKLAIKTQTVLGQYHPDAQQYYNLTNSLKQVTKKFQNKEVSLKSQIMLFHPIKPMLAGKKPLEFFDQSSKEYLLQTKFDGQRLQVHMNALDIKLFSRNAKDYTHIYKQLVPIIRQNIEADACILDGEILVLESHSLKMVPFGMNKQVALDKQNNPHLQICYKIFDCLWVKCDNEDVNLMEHELKKRKDILGKFVKEIPGKLEIVKGELVRGSETIKSKFHESIARNQEGIILKDPSSPYAPNDRSVNWIKLKGDYYEGLNDTMDLMIIGGYYGETSYRTTGTDWTDRITTFLLGVVSQLDINNPKNTHVIPFCKVGTGYSETELSQLRHRLRKHWIRTDGKRPSYLVGNWKPKPDDRPDCFINFPENSVILQVKAAELIKSDAFGAEKTLRFSRVVKIRYDKDWNECLNFVDLQSFINNESTKGLRKRARKQGDSEEENGGDSDKQTVIMNANKKIKVGKGRQKNVVDVLPWFKFTEIHENEIVSNIFTTKQFCILNLKNYQQKPGLERKILENGGIIVQNPVSTTNFIISEVIDFKYRALVSSRPQYLFIKPLYIDACIIENRLISLSPLYLSTIPKQSAEYFNTEFDYFGDSFTELINLRELDFILKSMDETGGYGELDRQLISKLSIAGAYQKPQVAYCVNLKLEQRIEVRNLGYVIEESISDRTEQIILGNGVNPNQLYLQQIRKARPEIFIHTLQDIKKSSY